MYTLTQRGLIRGEDKDERKCEVATTYSSWAQWSRENKRKKRESWSAKEDGCARCPVGSKKSEQKEILALVYLVYLPEVPLHSCSEVSKRTHSILSKIILSCLT